MEELKKENISKERYLARAVEMTAEEFHAIMYDKETPDFVVVDGRLFYNEYTCWNASRFGGTCSCASHPSKVWVEFVG